MQNEKAAISVILPASAFRLPISDLFRIAPLALLSFFSVAISRAESEAEYRDLRYKMVKDYIEREGITNRRVLDAMRTVPRHEFVLPAMKDQAYQDTALAIGHKQTISPPYVVAYMTQTIDPQQDDKVLEIGTGSGYQAAVLSRLVSEVYTIEIVEELGLAAAKRLERLGYANVHCKIGDGYRGWQEKAPFDKIIVTCSPEDVPQPLVEQLAEGGKLLIPLGERYQQVFHLFEKQGGKLVQTKLISTLFVPMTGESEENRKVKPDPEHPTLRNAGFEADENEDGLADDWHYQRMAKRESEDAQEGKWCLHLESKEAGRIAQGLQGMAIDGTKIGYLQIRVKHRQKSARFGDEPYERPGLYFHFYDEQRRDISNQLVGPWQGTTRWKTDLKYIPVPLKAREMIVRVGLNGGTGELWVDDIQMTPQPR
jgi:protein-L-isoaspartate(D-aspartate) O-methyltransferase